MAIRAAFSGGILKASGDRLDDSITFSSDLAGNLVVNGGAVPIKGTTPTTTNTSEIQAQGSGGNDTITIDETNGPMPSATLSGGAGDDTLIGGATVVWAVSAAAQLTTPPTQATTVNPPDQNSARTATSCNSFRTTKTRWGMSRDILRRNAKRTRKQPGSAVANNWRELTSHHAP